MRGASSIIIIIIVVVVVVVVVVVINIIITNITIITTIITTWALASVLKRRGDLSGLGFRAVSLSMSNHIVAGQLVKPGLGLGICWFLIIL